MITDLIVKRILEWSVIDELVIRDLCISYPYTYAIVEGGHKSIGVALTPLIELSDIEVWRPPRIDFNSTVREAVEKLTSTHMFERALALAVVNAVSQYVIEEEIDKLVCSSSVCDVVGIIERSKAETIAVVGNMSPLVRKLREKGYRVIVFERDRESRVGGVYSDCLEQRLLPEADAVVITGATILNDTLDNIIAYARPSSIKVMVGATAQTHPSLLEGVGLDYISSCHSRNPDLTAKLLRLSCWRKALFDESIVRYTVRVGRG